MLIHPRKINMKYDVVVVLNKMSGRGHPHALRVSAWNRLK